MKVIHLINQKIASIVASLKAINPNSVKSISGTFGVKVLSVGLIFGSNVLLARFLGVESYGTYAYVISWISLLGIISGLGTESLLVREISAYSSQSRWPFVSGILKWSGLVVFSASILLIALVSTLIYTTRIDFLYSFSSLFIAALISLPFIALTKVSRGVLEARKQALASLIPSLVVQPALFVGVILFAQQIGYANSSAIFFILAKGVTLFITLLISLILLYKNIPKQVFSSKSEYEVSKWTKSIIPYIFLGCIFIVDSKVDILMLGAIRGSEAVGIYSVAARGGEIVMFFSTSLAVYMRPRIAEMHASGNIQGLQKVTKFGTRILLLATLCTSITLVGFGKYFLLIFGKDFAEGYTILIILVLARSFNSVFGMVGPVLSMTSHADEIAKNVATTVIINIILNYMLIPRFGVEGAAFATLVSIVFRNLLLYWRLNKTLNLQIL